MNMYYENEKLKCIEYYINNKMRLKQLMFNKIFTLLKFKDILKSRYRKPIYNE